MSPPRDVSGNAQTAQTAQQQNPLRLVYAALQQNPLHLVFVALQRNWLLI
jgi:hypothetical protein